MKIYEVILSANTVKKDNSILHLTKTELKEVEKMQNLGGFKRFSVDIAQEYDQNKRSKFFALNRELSNRELTHFLERNFIITE
jgi:hypothetical protein